MREIGAFEAKNKLGTLLDWVERGDEVLITRRGRPVARLVPHAAPQDRQQVESAAARIRERARTLKAGAFDWQEWKAYRDETRP
jgi:prevent-host-death family protein